MVSARSVIHVELFQSIWLGVRGLVYISVCFEPSFCVILCEQTSMGLSDLGGRDLLKVDVVAAAVNLIFLHVPAL